jgi:hypothetical protein
MSSPKGDRVRVPWAGDGDAADRGPGGAGADRHAEVGLGQRGGVVDVGAGERDRVPVGQRILGRGMVWYRRRWRARPDGW